MKTELKELATKTVNPQLEALPNEVDKIDVDKTVNAMAKVKQTMNRKSEIDTKLDDLERRKAAGEDISEELKEVREKVDCEIIKSRMKKADMKPLHDKVLGDGLLNDLTKLTECEEIAANTNREMQTANSTEKMLLDQMSAAHVLSLKWMTQIYNHSESLPLEVGNKMINAVTRLMETYQKGAITLHKLRTGGKQTVIVKHQHVQVSEGGQALITDEYKQGDVGGSSEK